MTRRRLDIPEAGKRMIRGAWSIHWRWGGAQYAINVGLSGPENEGAAESVRRAISAALAAGIEFPSPFDKAPAAIRYRNRRYVSRHAGTPSIANAEFPGDWLADYGAEIKTECDARWAANSMATLRRLDTVVEGISKTLPDQASKFLADIADSKKAATRNRALSVCSRFFKWAVRTGRAKANPFAGIKRIQEERRSDIVHCTPAEREEAIAAALATGRPEWLAIPVAFYTGMRREEVSRLEWSDVRFREGLLVARITKTGKSRTIPLNATLEALLLNVPETKRRGYVVAMPENVDRLWRMDNLIRAIQKAKKDAMLGKWAIPRPAPSRSKDYKARKAAWEMEKRKRDAELTAALARIGWNSFRHTFGSLLAQAGVSLDKISAWMGNTPEVCRRHYAQFIPRDRRDKEIDKL